MSQTRVLTVERPHDYLYDRIYQVSNERDHARATMAAATTAQRVVSQPNFDAMFSELHHYPRAHYVMNQRDLVPRSVNRHWTGIRHTFETGPADVGGRDRFRFFRRPVMPYATQLPPDVVLSAAAPENLVTFISHSGAPDSSGIHGSGSRSVATQTLFRDSEVQTEPYTPDYVVRAGELRAPEVLTLAALHSSPGGGLPGGEHEVDMLERARRRRDLEAQLPSPEDRDRAHIRRRMMDAIEREEWRVRESQIEQLQSLRLGVLVKLLQQREDAHQELSNQRLDRTWTRKQKQKEKQFASLKLKHVKALRQLVKRYRNVENKQPKRDIVHDYRDPDSQVWAPLTRIGQFIDRNNRDQLVNNPYLTTYEGLQELEASLPQFVLNPKIVAPRKVELTKAGFKKRKYREEEKLAQLYESLKQAVVQKNIPEKPLKFLEKIEKPVIRPPTPTIVDPEPEEEDMEKAVILLQQLIRGKAIQAMMFEGKEKRRDLIDELRSTHSLLNHELEVNKHEKDETIQLQRQRFLLEHRDEKITEELDVLEASSLSQVVDELSKELVRLQEERRCHAIFLRAERERRLREAEESGMRQLEERRRREQDEIFKQVVKTHQACVDTYLEEIITGGLDSTANAVSQAQIESLARAVNEQAYEDERENTALQQEEIVGDIVHNFLIPEVFKQSVHEKVVWNQHRFLNAAHREIVGLTDDLASIQPVNQTSTEAQTDLNMNSSDPVSDLPISEPPTGAEVKEEVADDFPQTTHVDEPEVIQNKEADIYDDEELQKSVDLENEENNEQEIVEEEEMENDLKGSVEKSVDEVVETTVELQEDATLHDCTDVPQDTHVEEDKEVGDADDVEYAFSEDPISPEIGEENVTFDDEPEDD